MRLLRGRSTPATRAIASTLPLFVAGVLADDPHNPAPADHLAFVTNLLHRCTNLHDREPPMLKSGPGQHERAVIGDRHRMLKMGGEATIFSYSSPPIVLDDHFGGPRTPPRTRPRQGLGSPLPQPPP